VAILKENLLKTIRFRVKDSQFQWTDQIEQEIQYVLQDILKLSDYSWAIRQASPDKIPQGTPPRIQLPADFFELLDDGVIPVFVNTYAFAAPGRVVKDSWQTSVTEWPYYRNSGTLARNNSYYGYGNYPFEPFYNRVSVSPEKDLHFLNSSNHAYRINYKAMPPLSQWPDHFENVIASAVAGRLLIPLEGQDLIAARAQLGLGKSGLEAISLDENRKNQAQHRQPSRAERRYRRFGIMAGGPSPIVVPLLVPSITIIDPPAAKVGQLITLTGVNINQIATYSIGGTTVALSQITTTSAIATVPALTPGTYVTELTHPGSVSAVAGPPLQVQVSSPTPAILSLSGADWVAATATGSIVSEIKLTGQFLSSCTEFRAGNIKLEVDNLGTDAPSIYFPTIAGTYSLVGISPNGPTPPFTINVAAYSVVTIPAPTLADINFDLQGNNGRLPSDPNTERNWYAAGLPASTSWKFYAGPTPNVQAAIAGRGPQNAGASYYQIYQHSFPRVESRHTRVEIKTATTQYFSISQQKWILVEQFDLRGAAFAEDFVNNQATGADQFQYPDGTWSVRSGTNARGEAGAFTGRKIQFSDPGTTQDVGFNIHGFDFRFLIPWADAECVLLTCAMRAVGPGAATFPPKYIANLGIDSWKDVNSNFDNFVTHGGAGGGRLKPITDQWQNFTSLTGPVARLTTNPPLGFAGGGSLLPSPNITALSPSPANVSDTVTISGTNLQSITDFKIGTTTVALGGTSQTSRTFVVPVLPAATYTTTYTSAVGTATGPSIEILPQAAPPGSVPTITGFNGGDFNNTTKTGSVLTELTVLGTNLNVITAFKAQGVVLPVEGLGTTTPKIILPVAAGQVNITADYP
jgi:hypothetical protein